MEAILTDELLNHFANEYEKENDFLKSQIDFDTYLDTKLFNLNCDINKNAEFKYI